MRRESGLNYTGARRSRRFKVASKQVSRSHETNRQLRETLQDNFCSHPGIGEDFHQHGMRDASIDERYFFHA